MTTIAIMDMPQALAWGVLISSIVSAIVSIIVASKQAGTEKKVDELSVKADGALTGLQKELKISENRGEQLKTALVDSGIAIPAETKQTAPIPNPAPVHVEEPITVPAKPSTPT